MTAITLSISGMAICISLVAVLYNIGLFPWLDDLMNRWDK